MTLRVITGDIQGGNTGTGNGKTAGEMMVRPAETPPAAAAAVASPPARGDAGGDLAVVAQLVERLESLSFAFEALNAGSRTYAAEAVMEALARMERRDLQTLAAIEALASALKTVSQHLAGLRNTVQSTAHDTAAALEHISERLARLEGRVGLAGGTDEGLSVLEDIAAHLVALEAKVAEPASAPDLAPLLETVARRLSRVERKLDEGGNAALAPGSFTATLDAIARRVSRIERRMDAPLLPAVEVDVTPLHQALEAIGQRVADLERKLDAGGDGLSLASCLAAVAERLERIETTLAVPTSPGIETASAAADPAPPATAPTAPEPPAAPAAPPVPATEETAAPRQRVDLLLEQVFRVLSR